MTPVRADVTGLGAWEAPVSTNWHCQNPSKAASSVSTWLASGGCRFRQFKTHHRPPAQLKLLPPFA